MNLSYTITNATTNISGLFVSEYGKCTLHAQEMYGKIYSNLIHGRFYYYTLIFVITVILYHLIDAYEKWKGENGITKWIKEVFSWYFLLIGIVHLQLMWWAR